MIMAITRFIHEGKIHNCTKTKFCKKDTEKDSCKTYTLCSLIWKKHIENTESAWCLVKTRDLELVVGVCYLSPSAGQDEATTA